MSIGLAIELYNSINDPSFNTILAQSNKISVNDSIYRFNFPSIDTYTLGNIGPSGILKNDGAYENLVTLEVVTQFSFPFNIIEDLDVSSSLILPTIGDVEDAIQGKQDTIQDGDLTIAKTDGLQTALDNKYDDTGGPIIRNVDISGILLVLTTDIIDELGTKQPTIQDGDVIIAKTDTKQDEIDEDTLINLTSITSNNLVIDESFNIDSLITYEKYKQFNTTVIRRFDETDFRIISLKEIQCWVNDIYITTQQR